MFNSTMSYNVVAGDVVIAVVPFEMLKQAQDAFPASIGYRFERQ